MAKFRFALEQVLQQRLREERRRQRDVAELERERLRLEEAIRSRQRSIVSCKDDLRSMLDPGDRDRPRRLDLRSVRHQMHASLHLTSSTQPLAIELAGVHQRLESARGRLREATTARKAVEQLKARRYEEWKREQDRRETNLLDEIATTRAARSDRDEEDSV